MIRRYGKTGGVLVPLDTISSPQFTITDGIDLSTSFAVDTVITCSATPHTKGAWTQVIASTSAEASYIEFKVHTTNVNGVDTSTLLDIGIGGAGAETVLIANVAAGFKVAESATQGTAEVYMFAIKVPAGSRLSVRGQSVIASKTVNVGMILRSSVFDIYSTGIDTIGANTSTSNGVSLSPAGAVNTKGAWTEITSSTSNTYQALILGVQLQSGATTVSTNYMLVDVAVGASGSEVAIIQNVLYATGSAESIQRRSLTSLNVVDVPAGSRLSARYQRPLNGSVGLILYGVK